MTKHQTPSEYHLELLDMRHLYPLQDCAFFRPRTLSLPQGDVICETLLDLVDFVLNGEADDATMIEQAEYILAATTKIIEDPVRVYPKDAKGRVLFDAPVQGEVTRAQRTDEEKIELLKDPNLPADLRNLYEHQLRFPITPMPVKQTFLYPLPTLHDANGEPVSESRLEGIKQDSTGVTTFRYKGPEPLAEFTLTTGSGELLPRIPGAKLEVGAVVSVPLYASSVKKISAEGVIFRDGLVLRDNAPIPEAAAEDKLLEEQLARIIHAELYRMVEAKATRDSMIAYVRTHSYRYPAAITVVTEYLRSIGKDFDTY